MPDEEPTFEPDLVFAAMPFNGTRSSKVWEAIQDECGKLGLQAKRVDEEVGSDVIVRQIADLIERAEFIVCDLTEERPSVYYELGYAHGVGNGPADILLIAREGTAVHFDVAAFRVRFFSSIKDLRRILHDDLDTMMINTRRHPDPPSQG